jgi:hypothetical protein
VKPNEVVLALSLIVVACSHAAAQESLEFTLDEVDAADKPATAAKRAPVVDAKQVIEHALGEIRWGMSKSDLLKVLKAQVRAEFEQRIKVERDIMRQDALYQEAQDQYRRMSETFIAFDGPKTGWDVSAVGPEFTQGNREAMLVVAGKTSRDLYFFIQGKLWKWYRELSPEALHAEDANEALAVLNARFGPGKSQQDRRNESNTPYPGSTWSNGSTRVTTLRRGSDICLIFEDARVLEQLAVLRHHVQPKTDKDRASAAIDSVLLSGAELEARH